MNPDVLVVGAGPAGLAAAERLASAGLSVILAERQSEAGGMPLTCGHSPFGLREFHRVLGGRAYADRLIAAALRAGAVLRTSVSVTSIHPGGRVDLLTPDGSETLTPRRILLATGAREATRAERLLPGERPLGVVTTGTLQDMWYRHGAVPFRQPVILGNELVAMSAILTCRAAGANPLAVLETGEAMRTRAPFRWLPRALGLPVHTGVEITDLMARDSRLAAVRYRVPDGTEREIDCDGLVLTGGFCPEAALARLAGLVIDPATNGPQVDSEGRTSTATIFAAGNLLRGVETAGRCWAEGRAVAAALLADLERPQPPATIPILAGAGLEWIMPQALVPGTKTGLTLQARASAAIHGTLRARDASGVIIWTCQTASAPERPIRIPQDQVPLDPARGPITFSLEA